MTCYCSLVHFIKWILALTGRLHLTCIKIWSNSHWLWNGASLKKSFIPTLIKLKKPPILSNVKEQKHSNSVFFFKFLQVVIETMAMAIFKWCCKSYHKTSGMIFLHKVRVKTHLMWNSHHRPNQDLHLCQENYISLLYHGCNHNDISFYIGIKDRKLFRPKIVGLICKS